MATEIEHKYLVDKQAWYKIQPHKGEHIRQGYLQNELHQTIRVRIKNKRGYIAVKGSCTSGAGRPEYEFRIPVKGAIEMLENLCKEKIEKTRYKMRFSGNAWEVDVFEGENEGLIIAEIELKSEDQEYKTPAWITVNVTGDARYYNSNLVIKPYTQW